MKKVADSNRIRYPATKVPPIPGISRLPSAGTGLLLLAWGISNYLPVVPPLPLQCRSIVSTFQYPTLVVLSSCTVERVTIGFILIAVSSSEV